MDISKTYIKMSDCEEIQEIFKGFDLNKFPNYAYDKVTERVSIIFWTPNKLKEMVRNKGNVLIVSIESDKEKNQYVPEYEGDFCDSIIWLPRQDQLQEMLGCLRPTDGMGRGNVAWAIRFGEYCSHQSFGKSMEQLWQAFVMKEKYNKTWDGKEWR